MNVDTLQLITIKQLNMLSLFFSKSIKEYQRRSIECLYGLNREHYLLLSNCTLRHELIIALNHYISNHQKLPLLNENIAHFMTEYEHIISVNILMEDCLNSGIKRQTAIKIFKPILRCNKRTIATFYSSDFLDRGKRKLGIADEFRLVEIIKSEFGTHRNIEIERLEYARFLLKLSKVLLHYPIATIEATLNEHQYNFILR
ncbi:hypothetical protein [Vibrio gangliei]|uniref:hypothetical protein n=1 Tax=Vibrio gangliei TaxID=2077090 RepID=UPI000D01F979|nr:hypothetical protein [Vibrio gangliei]